MPELRKALDGRVHPHHQVLLTRILAHIDFLEESLVQLQQEMEQYLDPFEEAMELVQSVVGSKRGSRQYHRGDWHGYDALCI